MKKDVIIKEHHYIQKVLTILCTQGIAIIFIFMFFYGRYFENINETIRFISFIIAIEFLGVIIYYILRKSNKNRYIFDSDHISKYKNHYLLCAIEHKDIIEIYYIRIRWLFLMQFGSGNLIIKYKNINNFENLNITMSLKDVNRISKKMKKRIIIK